MILLVLLSCVAVDYGVQWVGYVDWCLYNCNQIGIWAYGRRVLGAAFSERIPRDTWTLQHNKSDTFCE